MHHAVSSWWCTELGNVLHVELLPLPQLSGHDM